MKKISMPMNPQPTRGGQVARTIKANYHQASMINFVSTASFGATGVITYYHEEADNEEADNENADNYTKN